MDTAQILEGIFWFVAFLFSTTVHEAAHAAAALAGGDRTAYLGGQVSLSPIPHIRREPIGMLAVPLLTALTQGWAMGWASAPYDPLWAERHPKRAAWMAAAGPAGNFLIALVAGVILRAGLGAGYFTRPSPGQFDFSRVVVQAGAAAPGDLAGFFAEGLSVLFVLNVLLGTFNLVPLPPLDGASVLGLILPERAAAGMRRISTNPMFSLVGLLVAWRVFPYAAMPLLALVFHWLYLGIG